MKKGLFLLPLAGALILSGCTFELFGKKISLFEKEGDNTSGKTTPSGGTPSGGNTPSGGGSVTPTGSLVGTITMTKNTDLVQDSVSENEATFEKGSCSIVVGIGTSSSDNSVQAAVNGTGNYEFRVYQGFTLQFNCETSFKELAIKYSSYTSGTKTYYFDYDDVPGASVEDSRSTYTSLLTLDAATTSFDFSNSGHQVRIASVSFYA